MHALDRRKLPYPSRGKPVEEFGGGARIGAACVRIADIGGEEFKEAIGGALADGGDEGGSARRRKGRKLVIERAGVQCRTSRSSLKVTDVSGAS